MISPETDFMDLFRGIVFDVIELKKQQISAASIMALVAFANVFAYILTKEHIPFLIANFIVLGLVTYVPFITGGIANLVLGG